MSGPDPRVRLLLASDQITLPPLGCERTDQVILLILIIVLIVFAVGGGHTYNNGAYRRHGFGCGGLLLVALIVFLVLGAIRA